MKQKSTVVQTVEDSRETGLEFWNIKYKKICVLKETEPNSYTVGGNAN